MKKSSSRADASGRPAEGPPAGLGASPEVFPLPADGEPPAAPEGATAALSDALFSAPVHACWIGFSAWLRYSNAVAEAFARYEAGLAGAALASGPNSGASPPHGRALVDETRALLRRVGEAASLEARRAQFELEKVGESIARAAAAAEGDALSKAPYVRRHEVKA